jgi:hypothetical protein
MILSIPLNNKPLFAHLDKFFTPYKKVLFIKIKNSTKQVITTGQQATKNLFENSTPKVFDSINSTISGIKKHTNESERIREELEYSPTDFTQEEKKLILEALDKSPGL